MGGLALLLLGIHLYFTLRTKGVQRWLFQGLRRSLRPGAAQGGVSAGAALATNLAACLGTGNLVGISTAVALGGPGAVFWCWLAGLLGMATRYAESWLAVRYQQKRPDGTTYGGPAEVMRHGLHCPWLACCFGAALAVGNLATGAVLQSQAVGLAAQGLVTGPYTQGVCAVLLALLAAPAVLGGMSATARLCEKLVPLMAGAYLLAAGLILWQGRALIPQALEAIVRGAFGWQAAGGGFSGAALGAAMRYGISRGLFSNEAGMGTAPILDAQVPSQEPSGQALVSMTGVFWDTVVVCAITGLVVVMGQLRLPAAMELAGAEGMTQMAFTLGVPGGRGLFALALFCFAYTSVIGCSVYCLRGVQTVLGPRAARGLPVVYLMAVALAPMVPAATAWQLAEVCNYAMALPNLLALLLLRRQIAPPKN